MRSETVITKMKGMFSRFGIPRKLVTDNAKQFKSEVFEEFAKKWEFQHVTSSPLYPRSNGLAERNVQTVKRLLKKASEDKTEWPLALLNFRNTPLTGEEFAPAQLLMGRSLNTRLPVATRALRPTLVEPELVRDARHGNIRKMKKYYDRGTKSLPALCPGEQVRVKDGKVWNKAEIIGEADGERSYWLKTDNGTYRRNRSHIISQNNKRAVTGARHSFVNIDNSVHRPAPPGESVSAPPPLSARAGEGGSQPAPAAAAAASNKVSRSGRLIKPPQRYVCT